MKKNASRLCLKAFFFIYYDQVLNNLYIYIKNHISGVMVSMLVSSAVDHGFISGVMVSMLVSSAVDHGFKPQSR